MESSHHNKSSTLPPFGLTPKELWGQFQEPKLNHWAFQNIDKFISHDVIPGSSAPVHLPRELRDINEIQFSGDDGISRTVGESLGYLMVDGLIVIKDSIIRTESYFNGMQPDRPHLLFSASKPFAGALIANLIHKGAIQSENDRVIKYIPELNKKAFNDVSIRNLLDMQSGIDFRDLGDRDELERASGFKPPKQNENILSLVLNLHKKKHPAGCMTDYNSINTDLLSLLATRITEEPASILLHRDIFEPMGAEFKAYIIKDQQGINELGGGLAITVRDLVKFGIVLLNSGVIGNRRVLPDSILARIFSTAEPEKWRKGWLASLTPQAKAYRAQLYLCADKFDEGAIFACGNYGQALYINPNHNAVIGLLSTYQTAVDLPRFNTQMAMLKAISEQVQN
jgi:CubicO group peptidase (beta-lactamase class C family)